MWVEVVTLLIRLVDRTITLVLRMRQLNDVLLVDIGTVLGILTFIERRALKIVINNLECVAALYILGTGASDQVLILISVPVRADF